MSTIKPPSNQAGIKPDTSNSPKSLIPLDQPAASVTEPVSLDKTDHGKGESALVEPAKPSDYDAKKEVFGKDFPAYGVTDAAAKASAGTFATATLQGNREAREAQKAAESASYRGENAAASFEDEHQAQFPHASSKLDNTVPNSLNTAHQQMTTTGLEGVDLHNALRNAGVGSAHDAVKDPISAAALVDWLRVPDADAYEFGFHGNRYYVSGHEIAMLGLNPNQFGMVVKWFTTHNPTNASPKRDA